MEKAMAEYIADRKDWDFASVEMGVNMLNDGFGPEQFESTIKEFVAVLSEEKRPVFATSIFGFNGTYQDKGKRFREIVEKYAKGNLHFVDGLELLNNPSFISADMVHPTLEGIEQITERWGNIMRKKLEELSFYRNKLETK